MKRLTEYLEIEPGKGFGFLLVLLGLLVGVIAQLTFPPITGGEENFWNTSIWWETLGENSSPLLGLLLYALAGLIFISGLGNLGIQNSPSCFEIKLTPISRKIRFGFWLTSLGLSVFTSIYASRSGLSNQNSHGLTFLWFLSIFLFSISVLLYSDREFPILHNIQEWLVANRKEIFFVGLLILGAFLIRFLGIEIYPYAFINDEGETGKVALCILSGKCNNPFAISWAAQPTLAFVGDAIAVYIFGRTALAIRMVSVLVGTMAVLFVYLFARETFGKKTAWAAAIILASLPHHIHFSRLGVDTIIDSLSSSLLLWLVFHAAHKGKPGWYLAAGIVAGLCLYTYPGTRLSVLLALGALGLITLGTPRFLRAQWQNLVVFAVAALITAGPIAAVFFTNPDWFLARFNGVGLLQTGGLQSQVSNTGPFPILLRQFLKSSLVFIATPGPGQFFNSPRPYYSVLGSIFLMLGLFIVARRIVDTRNLIVFAWFFGAIILGSTLTSAPPSNQRMLSSSAASAVVAAIGLVTVIEALQHSSIFLRRVAPVLMAAVLLFNSYQDLTYYFITYNTGHYFEDVSNELTYESHELISSLGSNGNLYLIAMPMTSVTFGNFDYFSPDVIKANLDEITRGSLATLPKDKDALFIAASFREKDIRNIKDWLPGGQWITANRRFWPNQPLFFAYKITKAQLQAFQP